MLLSLENHPRGPRVRALGQRIHHGAIGCALATNSRKSVRLIGLFLIAHDLHDWRDWFRFGWQS